MKGMIQIHILRSADVDKETLQGVHNYLAQFLGVMQFRFVEQPYQIGRYTDLPASDAEIEADFMRTVVAEQTIGVLSTLQRSAVEERRR